MAVPQDIATPGNQALGASTSLSTGGCSDRALDVSGTKVPSPDTLVETLYRPMQTARVVDH